jgi:SPP1 family predicted phage head-tail adaptor
MRAGRLRHRLILQEQVETREAGGGVVVSWVTRGRVWGGIEPLSGKEYTAIQQTQNEATVRIVMRYHPDIDPTWRIKNDDRIYTIQAIIDENYRHRMLILMCLEGVKEI